MITRQKFQMISLAIVAFCIASTVVFGQSMKIYPDKDSGVKPTVDYLTTSPNGGFTLAVSLRESLRIWDNESGKQLFQETINRDSWMHSVGESKSGCLLASFGRSSNHEEDCGIRVRNVTLDTELMHVPIPSNENCRAMLFSSNGSKLCLRKKSKVEVFDVKTGRLENSAAPFETGCKKIAFVANSNLMVVGGFESGHSVIKLWDFKANKIVASRRLGDRSLQGITTSADGTMVACAWWDKVGLFGLTSAGFRPMGNFNSGVREDAELKFSSDGLQLWLLNHQFLMAWAVENRELVCYETFEFSGIPFSRQALSQTDTNPKVVFTSSEDNRTVKSIETGRMIEKVVEPVWQKKIGSVNRHRFSSNISSTGKLAVQRVRNAPVLSYEISSGEKTGELAPPRRNSSLLPMQLANDAILTSINNNMLRIDLVSQKMETISSSQKDWVLSRYKQLADGRYLVFESSRNDRFRAKVLSPTGRLTAQFELEINSGIASTRKFDAFLSQDDKLLACRVGGQCQIFDLESEVEVAEFLCGTPLGFLPTGQFVFDSGAKTFDLNTGEETHQLPMLVDKHAKFLRGREFVVTSGKPERHGHESKVRVWNLKDGTLHATIATGQHSETLSIMVSHESKFISVLYKDGEIETWKVSDIMRDDRQ